MKKNKYLIIIVSTITLLLLAFWFKGCIKEDIPKDPYIKLYLSQEKKIEKMRLEEYLIGCVAAEMPASFELEALKAQAVCARTYALRKLIDQHSYPQGANLSDDITTCQAYVSPAEFNRRHPQNSEKLLTKIKQAVRETEGVVMLFDHKPIDAVYHSTCGGQTVSGEEAWGNKVPYLQSVKCPYCKESKHYSTVQVFSYQDINKALGAKLSPQSKIKVNNYSSSGRALEMNVDEKKFSAAKFRELLSLPSTWVKLTLGPKGITVNTRGYGHGAGLCQYGANGMAKDDNNYEQILNHYYKDIKIYQMKY